MFSLKMLAIFIVGAVSIGGAVSIALTMSDGIELMSSPQSQLTRNPNLVAACQYEFWKNTTTNDPVLHDSVIEQQPMTNVYWICYYRDGHNSVQNMGKFKDTVSASAHLWYYYENGKMPLIKVMS